MKQDTHSSLTERLPSDQKARREALDPARSFSVTAPAGSGKTELLTQRVLSLLAHCDKPEEILAITFTIKAASEMHQRIIDALRFAADNDTAPASAHKQFTWQLAKKALLRSEQQQWQLLEQPKRLRVQTIDGFCRFLSKQQPITSQLGALPASLDEHQRERALQQAFRETLDELESDEPISHALRGLLQHFDNNVSRLETLIIDMLKKREQWLPHLINIDNNDDLQDSNRFFVESLLSACHTALKPWQVPLIQYYNHMVKALQAEPPKRPQLDAMAAITVFPSASVSQQQDWNNLFSWLFTKKNELRKPGGLTASVGLSTKSPYKQEIKEFFTELNEQTGLEEILLLGKLAPQHPIEDNSLIFIQHLKTVLLRCTARLRVVFSQISATDFTEVSLAALSALKSDNGNNDEPSDLSLKLDYRIKHILVDEFQDTSHLQYNLLCGLTEGWQPNDNHSLFIVGDAMQSCYAFRNADVRIFLEANQHGIGNTQLKALTLQENFRSEADIVEWNNQIFSDSFPQKENINLSAVTYKHSIAFKQTTNNNIQRNDSQAISCSIFQSDLNEETSDIKNDNSNETREAQYIVNKILHIQKQSPQESIAILVRNRNHIQFLLPHLKSADIHWQAVDMERLGKKMAIVDLMSLTRAMLYPADELAWHAVLRSPIVGLNLHDLHTLRHATLVNQEPLEQKSRPVLTPTLIKLLTQDYPDELSHMGKKILQRIAPIFQSAWQQQRRKSLRLWIEGIWYALSGPASINSKQLEDCNDFFSLLDKFEQQGNIIDWPLFQQATERLYARVETINEHKASLPTVQIMTMHKSKGLEFDHVFLPGLGKTQNNSDSDILRWNEYFIPTKTENNQQNLLRNVMVLGSPPQKGSSRQDSHYDFLKAEHKKKSQYENLRLLYVACTRAIKGLYLSACLDGVENKKGESTYKDPASNSLLSLIQTGFLSQASVYKNTQVTSMPQIEKTEQSNTSPTTSYEKLEYIQRLPVDYQAKPFEENHSLASYRGKESDDDDNTPEFNDIDNLVARLCGTAIHSILQRITEKGIAHWQGLSDDEKQKHYQWQLNKQRIPPHRHATSLEKIQRALETTTASSTGQWILNNQHQASACEQALYYQGKLAIIDRTFIFNDVRWIIDYKSAMPSSKQNLHSFLQDQDEQYRKQLEHYRFLFQAREEFPSKTALYFPLIDCFYDFNLAATVECPTA